MPPCSRILHLPFAAWCDTDLELFLALDDYEASLCPSCGRLASECREASNRWQVVADTCGPSAAIEQFQRDHEDDLPDGLMLGTRRLAPGEVVVDPLKAQQLADLAAVRARHAPPTPDE